MKNIEPLQIDNELYKNKLLQRGESILYLFQNKEKKQKKSIVITNKRLLLFDYLEKKQQPIINENFFTLNFDHIIRLKTINHLLWSDLEIDSSQFKFMLKKFDKKDAVQIEKILYNMKEKQIKINDRLNITYHPLERIETYSPFNKHKYDHSRGRNHKNFHHRKESKFNKANVQKDSEIKQRYCSHCGTKKFSPEPYCLECGELLQPRIPNDSNHNEEITLCPYCNAKTYVSDIYCSECGNKL